MHVSHSATSTSVSSTGRLDEATDQLGSHPGTEHRSLLLWLTNVSHAVNHFQNGMVVVLYPAMMTSLGFGYAQLGLVSAIQGMFGSATQAFYGFLAQFAGRTRLLGFGNLLLGFGVFLHGLVPSYPFLVGARMISSSGASAQHPVGASLLSANFPSKRGSVLALHNSTAQVGSLLAAPVAGLLLQVIGWREVFFITAIASVVMGGVYFFFHDRDVRAKSAGSHRSRFARGWASYARVFRNRNLLIISLVMMVGAAGRNEGADLAYLSGHLQNDFRFDPVATGLVIASLQVGSVVGPLGFGWLSDRLPRRGVLQTSLLLSSLTTWWLASQGAEQVLLMFNLFLHGAVSYSRNSLTQALVADSATDADRDAAFSSYYFIGFVSLPFWALLSGWLMDTAGFSRTFTVLGFSYLAGMLLLWFVRDPRSAR